MKWGVLGCGVRLCVGGEMVGWVWRRAHSPALCVFVGRIDGGEVRPHQVAIELPVDNLDGSAGVIWDGEEGGWCVDTTST